MIMPEHQNIEYKSIWKDEYLRWICGFANAQGGNILTKKGDTNLSKFVFA
jgi:ATP-dependent DNA helicase RecG